MNLYKLIDWNYVLIPMNRKKEKATEQRHSLEELAEILVRLSRAHPRFQQQAELILKPIVDRMRK